MILCDGLRMSKVFRELCDIRSTPENELILVTSFASASLDRSQSWVPREGLFIAASESKDPSIYATASASSAPQPPVLQHTSSDPLTAPDHLTPKSLYQLP